MRIMCKRMNVGYLSVTKAPERTDRSVGNHRTELARSWL